MNKDLVIVRTTSERYFYDNLRIEAEYDHKYICSDAVTSVDEAIGFLRSHSCELNDDSIGELTTAIQRAEKSSIIHIDISTEVVYVNIYTILSDL